ncbi:hypothetical protein PIROE2DRAFT_6963 [Piromyces sp. E2]|nr:hypothetical protein PIROE2DRAFT_6963 [Piromyces sp. E2]|eukprot:OUM65973.1 hypothetical protein PIROE2DRAFT_6963 [Piromyces sp. E2]
MDNWSYNYNDISNSLKYREIRVIFDNEKKYNISPYGQNHFNIYYSLILYSEKGSVLDFGDSPSSSLRFHFLNDEENQKLIFKNLTFKNYRGITEIKDHLINFSVGKDKNDISVEFENCNFIDINGYLLNIEITVKQSVTDSPQVLFKNSLNLVDGRVPRINADSFLVKYENCTFENVSSVAIAHYGVVIYDNCHFIRGNGFYEFPSSLICAPSYLSKVTIMNSVIEDTNLTTNKPFFIISEATLR